MGVVFLLVVVVAVVAVVVVVVVVVVIAAAAAAAVAVVGRCGTGKFGRDKKINIKMRLSWKKIKSVYFIFYLNRFSGWS